jgi:hypothetical protein
MAQPTANYQARPHFWIVCCVVMTKGTVTMAKKTTPSKASGHPFTVGNEYRNRDGAYQVISINEPNMVIRYLDGRTLESPIALQARIWENIQGDDGNEFELELA